MNAGKQKRDAGDNAMDRRAFLVAAAAPLVLGEPAAAIRLDELKNFKITKITGFRHVCQRPKLVGKNARLDLHGNQTSDNILRIATDQGIEGLGVGSTKPEIAKQLIGRTLDEYWKPGVGVVSPLDRADHALFDLIGKALNQPAWKLLGGQGAEWVPVYDGSIYFNDLLPPQPPLKKGGKEQTGVRRLMEEVEFSLEAGHRAFKIKIGRGHKWMEKDAGFERDVEVVKAIRTLVGEDVQLMVDANNGYDLETAKRWLDRVGDQRLLFIEEMFPEDVKQDLDLKAYARKGDWKTLVADGENARDLELFDPFIEAGAFDVYQPDIRAFGLTKQWELSRRLSRKRPEFKLAPHNWGSHLGLHMQLVLARGIPNFLIAEEDRSTSDLFDTSAFVFKEGKAKVPDLPGCGLMLREDVFKQKYAKDAWSVGGSRASAAGVGRAS
jgi:L-alanine-DL-glutamate epimerase-like enolase superfamily enzyme